MRYLRVVRGRKANAGGPWSAVGCKLWTVSFPKKGFPLTLLRNSLPPSFPDPRALSQDGALPSLHLRPLLPGGWAPDLPWAQALMEVWAHPFGAPVTQLTRLCVLVELPVRKRSCSTQPGSRLSAGGLFSLPADPDPELSLIFKSQDMGM